MLACVPLKPLRRASEHQSSRHHAGAAQADQPGGPCRQTIQADQADHPGGPSKRTRRTRADRPGGPATRTGRTRADQPGRPSKRTRRTRAEHPGGGPSKRTRRTRADHPTIQADRRTNTGWCRRTGLPGGPSTQSRRSSRSDATQGGRPSTRELTRRTTLTDLDEPGGRGGNFPCSLPFPFSLSPCPFPLFPFPLVPFPSPLVVKTSVCKGLPLVCRQRPPANASGGGACGRKGASVSVLKF